MATTMSHSSLIRKTTSCPRKYRHAFLSYPNCAISRTMLHAYVGIASRHGLESLYPEERHTTVFLLRRAARHQAEGMFCFWTVIAPDLVEPVRQTLAMGNCGDAWLLLESFAFELGRILPESVDPVAAATE